MFVSENQPKHESETRLDLFAGDPIAPEMASPEIAAEMAGSQALQKVYVRLCWNLEPSNPLVCDNEMFICAHLDCHFGFNFMNPGTSNRVDLTCHSYKEDIHISHINPHNLVNKNPVSCLCKVPESLRPSSKWIRQSVYAYSKHAAYWMVQTAKSSAWRSIFELTIFISESITFYRFERAYFIRVPDRCEASQEQKPEPQAVSARGHEAEGRKSAVVTRCGERIPRQQVQSCDFLWFMLDNAG